MVIPFYEDFVTEAGNDLGKGWGDGTYSGHGTFEHTGLPFVMERYKSVRGHGGGWPTGKPGLIPLRDTLSALGLYGDGGGTACANHMIGFEGPYSI